MEKRKKETFKVLDMVMDSGKTDPSSRLGCGWNCWDADFGCSTSCGSDNFTHDGCCGAFAWDSNGDDACEAGCEGACNPGCNSYCLCVCDSCNTGCDSIGNQCTTPGVTTMA